MKLDQDIQEVLISQEELNERIREIAEEITRDYAGKAPLMVGILRGSYIFMADLVRHIDLPITMDFMVVSSYGAGTVSSGLVNIRKDLEEDSLKGEFLRQLKAGCERDGSEEALRLAEEAARLGLALMEGWEVPEL